MGWFGLERTLKLIQCHPCHGRDTSHCPRLLQAPMSSLALGTARDPGAATAALGIPSQPLPTLPGNNSFPISHPALPSGTGKPFPVSCPSMPCPQSLCSSPGAPLGPARGSELSLEPSLPHLSHKSLGQHLECSQQWPHCCCLYLELSLVTEDFGLHCTSGFSWYVPKSPGTAGTGPGSQDFTDPMISHLPSADQATLIDQVKRVKEIEAIESDAFVPQTFRSSKEVKKSTEPPELQHEPGNVGAGTTEAAAPEKEPPAAHIPTAIKYQDDNSLAHPNLFIEKAEAEEKWFQRLVALRQERLMGSPVA
uniref:Uncharacterized protein n=1 Tax=Corvus moneduloides TaxID=1196302 RepID=A0A8C3DV74_CORMO